MKSSKRWILGNVIGIAIFIVLMLLMITFVSKAVLANIITDHMLEGIIIGSMFAAVFIAITITIKMYGSRAFITACMQITMILILLLFCSLVMEGSYHNVALRAGAIVIGGGLSYVICQRQQRNSRKRKRHYR